MSFLLDLIYGLLLFACSPLLVFRSLKSGKYREGWKEKFAGNAPFRVGDQPCLWFHAVSVGEVLLLRPLVKEMGRRRPNWEIVISTTTSTGLSVARRVFPDLVTFYAPLDFSWSTRRAMTRIRPTVLALVELELWPNLIRSAKRANAKVAIINARLSPRSFRGYSKLKLPLRSTLSRIDAVTAQTADYATRFVSLGVPGHRVRVTGSVKFDGLESDRNNEKTQQLRHLLGLAPSDLVFVAGSTMEGEEEAVLQAYRAARRHHPCLRLVLVPRHAERFNAIAAWLQSQGERVLRRSEITSPIQRNTENGASIVLVDTVGELAAVWGLADVAFVGGSLHPGRGGQNMMEPAAYGAAVMFGPHVSNFRDTVEQLLERNAARQIANSDELAYGLLEDLNDPESAVKRGSAGRSYVLAQNGASGRTVLELDRLVEMSYAEPQH